MKVLIFAIGMGVLMSMAAPWAHSQGDPSADVLAGVEALQNRLAELQAEAADRADDPTFYYELGNVYADLTRRDEAVAAYESALDLDPKYVEALVNLGAIRNEQGKSDEAVTLLTEAVELRPTDAKALVNLGNAYYSKGDYYEAMSRFRRALEVDPTSYEAYYQIGVAFADAGIYREAIRQWKRVVELAPGTDAAEAATQNIDVVEKILARKM